MQGRSYTSREIDISAVPLAEDVYRADIEFEGVDHSGASFEGRVFLNNPEADEDTELTPENGYAGSFFVFGHGGCFGDEGHCEVGEGPGPYDPRTTHPLTPVRMVLTATEALRRAASRGEPVTVSVVPVIMGLTEQCDTEDVFKLERVSIVSYKSEAEAASRM